MGTGTVSTNCINDELPLYAGALITGGFSKLAFIAIFTAGFTASILISSKLHFQKTQIARLLAYRQSCRIVLTGAHNLFLTAHRGVDKNVAP